MDVLNFMGKVSRKSAEEERKGGKGENQNRRGRRGHGEKKELEN